MRLISTVSLLAILIGASAAQADRHRRPIVRDHRGGHDGGQVRSGGHRGGHQPIVRDHGGARGHVTVRFSGDVRHDRRAVHRRPIHASNGRFTFQGGQTVVYNRHSHEERYYDVNYRPRVIVENYPAQSGYVWVPGSWSWSGYEWTWTAGYYAPDPSISTYYDDGSYDTYDNYE